MRFLRTFLLGLFLPVFSYSQHVIPVEYKLADSLYRVGNDESACNLFRALLLSVNDDSLRIESAVRLGYIMSDANKIDSAVFFLRKAVAECLDKKIYYRLSRTYNGIGNQFLLKRNFREAFPYYNEGLKSSTTADDSVRSYLSILVLHLKQKNYNGAYEVVNDELSKYGSNKIPYREFYIYQTKGNYFLYNKKYDSALFFLKRAASQTDDQRLKANVFNDIAETYRGIHNSSMAFAYQDSAAAANKILRGNGDNLLPFYDTYVKLYADQGDFRRALNYADSARHLSDSLFDADKNNASIDADAKYNNQKAFADRAIAEKERAITRRNLVITLFSLGIVVLLAMIGFRIARMRKKANAVLVQQRQQVQQLADELAVANETKARLFSTIGHDLRSPISSLYTKLKLAEIKNATHDPEMSSDTVQLLDTLEEMLVWSKSQMEGFVLQPANIPVIQLFEELEDFYTSSAAVKNISLRLSVPEKLSVKTDENILKTILRNAVSNAIANTSAGNMITLRATQIPSGRIALAVINPCTAEQFSLFKAGIENAKIQSRAHGFGIVLMKEFAQKLNAEIDLAYSFGNAELSFII